MKRTVAVFIVVTLSLAACSSSKSGTGTGSAPPTSAAATSAPPTSAPPTSAPPTSAPPTTSGSAPSQSTGGTGGLSQADAQGALLVASDVGGDFSQTSASPASSPLPCQPNDPPLDERIPPSIKAETEFENAAGSAALSEEIDGYADTATAQRVLTEGAKGLSCKTGTIKTSNGTVKVQLNGPVDLTSDLDTKVDKAEGWQLTAGNVNLVLIVSVIGQQIVAMEFSAAKSVDPKTLPDTKAVTEKALAKVKAAL